VLFDSKKEVSVDPSGQLYNGCLIVTKSERVAWGIQKQDRGRRSTIISGPLGTLDAKFP
jgi:hypothetical protein